MTLAIHDQGGLTEAEIKLAIEESAERREDVLDNKLAFHRAEIKAELISTRAEINSSNDKLFAMQGQISGLAAETKTQTSKIDEILRNGEEWHRADLEFRASITAKVSKIETDQAELTEVVSRLRWFGLVCFYTGRAFRFGFDRCKDADFWKLAATVLLVYVMKLASPSLARMIEKAVSR